MNTNHSEVVKIDLPWMFSAEQIMECIDNDELLQASIKNDLMFGEYKIENIKWTNIIDVTTLRAENAIFTIKRIYTKKNGTQPTEIWMEVEWYEHIPIQNIFWTAYKRDPSAYMFIVRALTRTENNVTHLERIITIDAIANDPRTYYNSGDGSK